MSYAARLKISGRVQGVFYRASTVEAAARLDVTGWVKNMPDGTVQAWVEGQKEEIEKLVKWCWQGSRMSNVTDVDVSWEEPTGRYSDFQTRY